MIANPICKHIGKSHEPRSNQNLPKSLQSRPWLPPLRAVLGFANPQKTK
jgi:hypothetical protein